MLRSDLRPPPFHLRDATSLVDSESEADAHEDEAYQSAIHVVNVHDLTFLQLLPDYVQVPQVNLPQKLGVQDTAPRWNRHPEQGAPYLLGVGASAIVFQHEAGEELEDIVEAKTIVAVKRYSHVTAQSLDADRDLARAIWQEVRVLCHSRLRDHENFSKLLCIGWEDYSVVPCLLFELAAYGSLKDALDTEFSLSWLQKCHLCLDIASAIDVLHACGFAHGDLKPENVMVQRHPDRQLIGKLLDFSGTTDLKAYGSSRHQRFHTRMWLPHEAITASAAVDWQKVDVFALGMICTHMFCALDFEQFACYLEVSLPTNFTPEEKLDIINFFKISPDSSEHSVLSQSKRLTVLSTTELKSFDLAFPLELVQEYSLTTDAAARKSSGEILSIFKPFAEAQGRVLSVSICSGPSVRQEDENWNGIAKFAFFALSEDFTERTNEHQMSILQYMIKISGPPSTSLEFYELGVDTDYDHIDSLILLLEANCNERLEPTAEEYRRRQLHYQIAICFLLGYGTKITESEGIRYLASAALGHVSRAMNMYASVEASVDELPTIHMPRQLLLCFGYLSGCTICADILAVRYPIAYKAVSWARYKANEPLWKVICLPKSLSSNSENRTIAEESASLDSIASAATDRSVDSATDSVFEVIAREDSAALQALLRAIRPVHLEHSSGLTALHALSLIEDSVAAEMLPLLMDAGADISKIAAEEQKFDTNGMTFGLGTPLIWAVRKSRALLFTSMLDYAIAKGNDLSVGDASLFSVTIAHRQPRMLEALLKRRSHFKEEAKNMTNMEYLESALEVMIEESNQRSLMLRWCHGQVYRKSRQATVSLVLDLYQDALQGDAMYTRSMRLAVRNGDAVALATCLDKLQLDQTRAEILLGRDGFWKEGSSQTVTMSAIYTSTFAASEEAFFYLLQAHPLLAEQRSSRGRAPIHAVAVNGSIRALEALNDAGTDLTLQDKRQITALVIALAHNRLDAAHFLVQHCAADKLLHPTTGPKPLSALLETYMNGRRHIRLDSFKFLHAHGALPFVLDGDGHNVFRTILYRGRPYLPEHVSADLRLMTFFLSIFTDHMNEVDWTGRAAIHYAAQYRYMEVLEMLVNAGADVNVETQITSINDGQGVTPGRTALDWMLGAGVVPRRILAGGAREIRAWEARSHAMLQFLIARGAQPGSSAPSVNHLLLSKAQDPEGFKHVHIHFREPDRGDQTWRGRWPERIPACLTTPQDWQAERLPAVWKDGAEGSDEDSDEGHTRATTIVRRRHDGRKVRGTGSLFELFGYDFEVPASKETDDDDSKLVSYDMLQLARITLAHADMASPQC